MDRNAEASKPLFDAASRSVTILGNGAKTKSVGVFEPAHIRAGKILPFAVTYGPVVTPPKTVPDPVTLAPQSCEDNDDEDHAFHFVIVPDGEDLA